MKAGDYVRTNDGIGRITKYKYEPEYENCHIIWFDDNNYGIRYIDNEIKSSPNIIDLIEERDIVVIINGLNEEELILIKDLKREKPILESHKIKSIVTKEAFENMKYKIGE